MRVKAKRRAIITPEIVEFFVTGGLREREGGGGVTSLQEKVCLRTEDDFEGRKLRKVGARTEKHSSFF